MSSTEDCTPIDTEHDLEEILKTKDTCFILFYAPWCPFSQRFLSVFEKCAQSTTQKCYRMEIDEHPNLCERFSVEVYPTVLFFKKEKVMKRLDGTRGIGLNETQLRDLINACRSIE
jgi:thioredoxin-like negative regulator of GroEL